MCTAQHPAGHCSQPTVPAWHPGGFRQLIALPAGTILIAIAAGVAGVGLSIFATLWETTLQREVPREVLSRVSAYDWFGSAAFVPLGYLIAAPLAALLGTRTTLFFAAAWAAGSCAIVLTVPSLRHLRLAAAVGAPAQRRHEPARGARYPASPRLLAGVRLGRRRGP